MAKPKNIELRDAIRARYSELLVLHFTRPDAVNALASERGCDQSLIYYYLRGIDTKTRNRVTPEIRQAIATLTKEELNEYAKQVDISYTYLYRQMLLMQDAPVAPDAPERKEWLVSRGWLDFTSQQDLNAFDITLKQVRGAKKTLGSVWGLSLAAPNYLVQTRANRRCALDYQEALNIITNPVKAMKQYAREFERDHRWEQITPTRPQEPGPNPTPKPTPLAPFEPQKETGWPDIFEN